MRREYNFIENLEPKDVHYVAEKKMEHAVILIQRNWRRLKAQREYRKSRMLGMSRNNNDYDKTDEDLKRIKENKDLGQDLRDKT